MSSPITEISFVCSSPKQTPRESSECGRSEITVAAGSQSIFSPTYEEQRKTYKNISQNNDTENLSVHVTEEVAFGNCHENANTDAQDVFQSPSQEFPDPLQKRSTSSKKTKLYTPMDNMDDIEMSNTPPLGWNKHMCVYPIAEQPRSRFNTASTDSEVSSCNESTISSDVSYFEVIVKPFTPARTEGTQTCVGVTTRKISSPKDLQNGGILNNSGKQNLIQNKSVAKVECSTNESVLIKPNFPLSLKEGTKKKRATSLQKENLSIDGGNTSKSKQNSKMLTKTQRALRLSSVTSKHRTCNVTPVIDNVSSGNEAHEETPPKLQPENNDFVKDCSPINSNSSINKKKRRSLCRIRRSLVKTSSVRQLRLDNVSPELSIFPNQQSSIQSLD